MGAPGRGVVAGMLGFSGAVEESDLGEFLAAHAAAVAEDGTTALGGHAGTETMLAHAADL
jgi:hypothetical protein